MSSARFDRHAVGFVAVAVVFVGAFVFRWVTLNGLSGDDHWSLWTAATFLKGDRPFRDFVDIGAPGYWAMSALAQSIVGYRVIGEVVLGTALIAFAFAVAFYLAWRASRSVTVAAGLIGFALLVIAHQKLYTYPKTFIYPPALWLCWRYIDRPTLLRSAVLALGVAVAFAYRHDHGAYVGVGAAAAVLAAHWPEGFRRVAFAWVRFGVLLAVLLSPYLLLIQANEGVVQYLQTRLQVYRQLDTPLTRRDVSFTVDSSASAEWFRIEAPRPARVFVEWKPEVSPETRIALERTYALASGRSPKKQLYEYFLTDVSRSNLIALFDDPRIVDRRGLQRSKALGDVVANDTPPPDAPPSARARVHIQWTTDVADSEISALERTFGLLDPTPDRNRWEYALTDVSTRNVRAIVTDPYVYDTGLIARDTYRPMEESWLVRVQRSWPLLRLSIAPRYWHGYNAGVCLYYLSLALPFIILVMLAADRIRGQRRGYMVKAPEKMFAAAVMMAVAYLALLRRMGYFADYAAVTAILGACLFGHVFSRAREDRPPVPYIIPRAAVAVLLVFFACASMTYANPLSVASLAGMNDGLKGVWEKSLRAFHSYNTSPPIDDYAPPRVQGDKALIRYIYECTRPDDRIWLLSDLFTFPYYTERRIVGHVYWATGFLRSPEYQRKTIERVDRQEVPIVLSVGETRPLEYLEAYPLVHAYVARRYTRHYSIPEDNVERGGTFWLLTDSRRQPTGTYERLGLPCFK